MIRPNEKHVTGPLKIRVIKKQIDKGTLQISEILILDKIFGK